MKHEWRKKEKEIYLPPTLPKVLHVPEFKYLTIKGNGNPNSAKFSEYIKALYSLAYVIKMSPKKEKAPKGYFDYTVYPLEGVWDISEDAKKRYNGKIEKDKLVFKLMIRQPAFVEEEFVCKMIEETKNKKPHTLLDEIGFEKISEGKCIQMMHIGSYETEPVSFKKMEKFAEEQELTRVSKTHREIYLNDARKVAPEKLKTVLRFQVKDKI